MSFLSKWFSHPRFAQVASGGGLIKSGHRGAPVRTLQSALIQLGHAMPISTARLGVPDGIFGNETKNAVRTFQKNAGKSVDGLVGRNTLGALDKKLMRHAPPASTEVIWGRAPAAVPGQPAEIDMGRHSFTQTAVKQMHDMACWAACLSYWARACGGGRPVLSQSRINAMYLDLVDNSANSMGGMSLQGIRSIMYGWANPVLIPGEDPDKIKWRGEVMEKSPSGFTYEWLNTNGKRPLYLGYRIGSAAHINVVWSNNDPMVPMVGVMEPWDGRFKLREFEYYQSADRMFFAYPV